MHERIAEMVAECADLELLGKSVQCIEIAEKVGSVLIQNFQVIFLTALRVDYLELLIYYVHCIEDC